MQIHPYTVTGKSILVKERLWLITLDSFQDTMFRVYQRVTEGNNPELKNEWDDDEPKVEQAFFDTLRDAVCFFSQLLWDLEKKES